MAECDSDDSFSAVRNDARRRVSQAIEDMDSLGLTDLLEARVMAKLLSARMTVSELVGEIYGQTREMPGFMSAYSRTRRAVRELESKGYVATRVLGRDRPYRLTKYAISRLADFETPADRTSLASRKDVGLYVLTALMAGLALGVVYDLFSLRDAPFAIFYSLFFIMVGIAATRFAQTLHRVM